MSKPSKPRSIAGTATRAETLMEKTTRAAKEIIDDQNAQRDRKTERLREARLERESGSEGEAETVVDPDAAMPKTADKKARAKKTESS
ncbi:MAG: hypothetical protein RID23_18365 [Roseovarius sp.]